MLHYHPLDASSKSELRAFYFQLVKQAGHEPEDDHITTPAHEILAHEESNAQAIILDALEHNIDTSTVLASIHFSTYLVLNIPRLEVAKRTIEAIKSHPSAETDVLLPLCWLRLGRLYSKLDKDPEGIDATEMAEKGYRRLNQLQEAAKSTLQLVGAYRLRGKSHKAIELIVKAYKDLGDAMDTCGMSSCHRKLAIIHFESGRHAEAVQALAEAQALCPQHHGCIMDTKHELGRIYRERDPSKAIELLTEAMDYYQLHGRSFKAAICLYQKSIAHLQRKDYDQADIGFNEAYEKFKCLKSSMQMAFCIYYQGQKHHRCGSFNKALELFERSKVMFEQMGSIGMVGFCLRNQGQVYAKLLRKENAVKAYGKALEYLRKAEGREIFVKLYEKEMLEICEMPVHVGILRRIRLNCYVLMFVVHIACFVFSMIVLLLASSPTGP
jgi:tetratricopeptide (TPR) repeat protein